jgi:hypothetical protein
VNLKTSKEISQDISRVGGFHRQGIQGKPLITPHMKPPARPLGEYLFLLTREKIFMKYSD